MSEEKTEDLQRDLIYESLSPIKGWVSTGCTVLDLAIADQLPGGFPAGRISHVFGRESTAKTVLATEPLGSVQRKGGIAYFEDSELSFDLSRAALFGVDVENEDLWRYKTPQSIEELFDEDIAEAIEEAESMPISMMSVDSLTALPSAAEIGNDLTKQEYGTLRAKQLSRAFRNYWGRLGQSGLAILFVDQAKADLSNPFSRGRKDTVAGGRALKFFSSVRIELKHFGAVKNSKKRVVGVDIGFKLVKNKVGPPFREGSFRLYFDYGIDDVTTNLQWLKQEILPKARGKKAYKLGEMGLDDDFAGSLDETVEYVEANNLEGELREVVEAVWKEVYAPNERKAKVRFG